MPAAAKKNLPSPEQIKVIEADITHKLLVIAGPGTGKTEVVAQRLAHLLRQGAKPASILVLSFSRSAVRALVNRISEVTKCDDAAVMELRHLSIRTFDSWTFRVLRRLGFPPDDLLRFGYETNIRTLIDEVRGGRRDEIHELLRHYRHIIVDEFQDLAGSRGALVLELLGLLSPPKGGGAGFTVLGDEAQAIYGFGLGRTGDGEFSKLTAKVILTRLKDRYSIELKEQPLTKNYRATNKLAGVVSKAREVLSKRITAAKKLEAMREIVANSDRLDEDTLTESLDDLLPESGVASVLCRTNGQALRVAHKIMGDQDEPPDILVGVTAGSRMKSVPAWIGATLGRFKGAGFSQLHFNRIHQSLYGSGQSKGAVAVPSPEQAWELLCKGVNVTGGEAAITMEAVRERVSWLDFLPDDEGVSRRGLEVLTIHQSKGMEYEVVALVDDDPPDGESPGVATAKEPSVEEIEEEANVLFVALSRASKKLAVISPDGLYPLTQKPFDKGSRSRCFAWKNGWVNLEMGLRGDINPGSFVDPALHGGDQGVTELQDMLAKTAADLIGHKVVLVRTLLPGQSGKFVYDIHLQKDQKPGQKLGQTLPQLTFDILNIIQGPKYSYPLPGRIFNLRIADVVTYAGLTEAGTGRSSPWRESGLWVGITLHGIGSFKTYQKK